MKNLMKAPISKTTDSWPRRKPCVKDRLHQVSNLNPTPHVQDRVRGLRRDWRGLIWQLLASLSCKVRDNIHTLLKRHCQRQSTMPGRETPISMRFKGGRFNFRPRWTGLGRTAYLLSYLLSGCLSSRVSGLFPSGHAGRRNWIATGGP